MYKANIYVTLKEGVLDPQGDAVRKSLQVLNYQGVKQVRIGKFIEVWLETEDLATAQRELEEMSDKMLANPVIENYRVEMVEVQGK
ncbi:MAG: phosphoribosylformylglycinamidine synthase subunit PurS [Syntrophomonadaceae bacterium]|nr:phosphoribosylformylglycinamidine synthase subunit PurS [Syntrophomonadaceae bacterium]